MKTITYASFASALCVISTATLATTNVQMQIDGSAVNAAAQYRNQMLVSYQRQVNEIVAGEVRNVRVEQEKTAMQQAGHPVPLPTGSCRAIVTVQSTGTIEHAQLAGCASAELGDVELKAIQRSSPLPTPPVPAGATVNVTVLTWAPVATPGIYGN